MQQYSLSPENQVLFDYRNLLLKNSDICSLTPQEIEEYNRQDFSKSKKFKNLYRPVKKNTITDTYIIPTSDGKAVTGYLVRKLKKKTSDLRALILYVHNGGWMLGNMDKEIAICSNICNITGADVLVVDYRLAPTYKFPTAIEDCYDAYLWAVQGTRYWRLEPSRIFLMGSCSGANMVCALSALTRDRKVQKPAGQILIDPITDCRLRTTSMAKYSDSNILSVKQLSFFISHYQREPKDILNPLFSPLLSKDFSRLPPTLILAADSDILTDDALLYEKALKSADSPVKCIVCKNRPHGFLDFPGFSGWKDIMSTISFLIEGIDVDSIEILGRRARKKLRKAQGPVVVQA